MKKIILAISAIITLATQPTLATGMNKLYIKATGGYSKFDKVHGFKSDNSGFIGLGVGFYIRDNIRTDLMFEHFIDPTHRGSRIRGKVQRNHKTKGKIESLTVNGYVDLFDIKTVSVFVGAGVGAARVEVKNTFLNTSTGNVRSAKYKAKTNFTYALHAGTSIAITPKVKGELFYSYKDFGTTKKNIVDRVLHYNGHHVGLGIRFDL